ncbi:protein transport protein HofC [Cricetibacter osteomyelitidis]|uniref:Protein transport protein HofC n=1 Tax=Cricetibacter osteomyelitidis TaxID=1521931 RepID=A0A4R2T2U5_9PAST|nr:type II secretion system F family protein [Cricetibacter osteomyelitidis]TCP95741.1 protein transport protein HofC [Cricetibacter osteomyelitidis]
MAEKLKLFRWKAVNRLQQKQRGSIVAENAMQAQQHLLKKGLSQVTLQQNWQLNSKPTNTEICDLLAQLATLLNARITLKQSLQIMLDNCINLQLNQWIRYLLKSIENGLSFSQALEQYPQCLNYQERQLIRVGELSGKLPQVCTEIAEHKKQALALQRKIQKILLYPMIVLFISLSLTLLLLIFIVPQFAEMYGDNQANLPVFTALLLNISEFLQQYWWSLCILTALFVLLLKYQLTHSVRCYQWKNRFMMLMPLLGKILQLSRLIGFCRAMQLMLQSGVPLNQALNSFLPSKKQWQSKKTVIDGDLWLQDQIKKMTYWIQQGYGFSESVSSDLFPLQIQQMLQVGEKSGQLAMILQQIADNEKQRLDHQIDLLSQLLEPLMMVIIGGLIGLIMLGMYMPIFNMGSLIQ